MIGKKDKPEIIEPEELSQDKVNTFNNFFATVGLNIQNQLKMNEELETVNDPNFPLFNFHYETEESIEKIIDNIKTNVATGSDTIPSN